MSDKRVSAEHGRAVANAVVFGREPFDVWTFCRGAVGRVIDTNKDRVR